MLKAIVWENFVHFKDKNVISFNTCLNETTPQGAGSKTGTESKDTDAMIFNDLNIFVGANFCGKSTVLELIRRCMTDEINVSETKPFNAQEVAYAFCQFNLDSYDFVISGIIKESCNGAEYKVFIYKDQNGTFLRSKASDNSFTFNGLVHAAKDKIEINALLNTSANANIPNLLRLIKENKQRNRIVGWACRLFTAIKSRILTKNNGPSWKTIEEKYIATFPLRGIGSVQWTKSRKLGKKHKASNYKIACERAEVISTLLSEKHKHHIDEEKEKKFFRYITYPEVFTFKEDKGVIVVQHDSGSDVPLLKISEGIIEAKVTSLLLAHKDIQTLCLEEPDRGMHPQMIERLKKELYKEACSKTIIVVTHSPYLIDTITVNKTHVFVRELDKTTDSYVCSVKNVGENKDLKQVSNIEIRRTLLFATKVLIVEGPTDREVVQGIFTQITLNILKDGKKRKYWSENDLSAYQIISMNGCDNTESIQAFCDFINLPWLCLWDLDKVVVYDKKTQRIKSFNSKLVDGEDLKDLNKDYKDKSVDTFYESNEDFKKISQRNTFIWKYGTLEDAILKSAAGSEETFFSKDMSKEQLEDIIKKCGTLEDAILKSAVGSEETFFFKGMSRKQLEDEIKENGTLEDVILKSAAGSEETFIFKGMSRKQLEDEIKKYGTLENAILEYAAGSEETFILKIMSRKQLKNEIKKGFNENDRQRFFSQILEFDVIKDFIKFMDEKEEERKKKYDARKQSCTAEITKQPCIHPQTLFFISFGIPLLGYFIYMVVNYLK